MEKVNKLLDGLMGKLNLKKLNLNNISLEDIEGVPFISKKKWALFKVIINTDEADLPTPKDWELYFKRIKNTKWKTDCKRIRTICTEILEDLSDKFFQTDNTQTVNYDGMMSKLYPSFTEIRKILQDYPDILELYEAEFNVLIDELEGDNFAQFSFHHAIGRLISKLEKRTK